MRLNHNGIEYNHKDRNSQFHFNAGEQRPWGQQERNSRPGYGAAIGYRW